MNPNFKIGMNLLYQTFGIEQLQGITWNAIKDFDSRIETRKISISTSHIYLNQITLFPGKTNDINKFSNKACKNEYIK